jgi:hypothetical protein
MDEIPLNATVLRSETIVVGQIDEDVMMADIETGKYAQLNPSGSRIWELLDRPKTITELCEDLEKEFKVSREICQRDVIYFLQELVRRGVVVIRTDS